MFFKLLLCLFELNGAVEIGYTKDEGQTTPIQITESLEE